MRLGLGLSLSNQLLFGGGGAPVPAYSPAELFQSDEAGIWYDYQDFSSMWQDSAGTVPAAVNQPVGRVDDKSGNGNHAVQATASARPILRNDGTNYYLEFDGVDDRLVAPYSGTNVYERVSAIRQIAWTLNDQFFSGGSGAGELRQTPSAPGFQIIEVGRANTPVNNDLAVGVNGVVTERYTGVDTYTQVNQGTEYTVTSNASPAPTQLSIGGRSNGTLCANMRLYGLVQRAGTLTAQQRADLQEYMAGTSGVNFP